MASIIIVDDDEIVAQIAADVLISAGHGCGWVTDASQAMQLLRWRRPDLLLLDNDMPEITGAHMLRQLRMSQEFYDLPVVMFTRLSGKMDEEQALFNGANDYIRKPFDRRFLLWRVNRLLEARVNRPQHTALEDELNTSAEASMRKYPRNRNPY